MEGEIPDDEVEDEIQEVEYTKPMVPSLPYKPKKVDFGQDHPTPLDEGSALTCVPHPEITAKLRVSSEEYHGVRPRISNAQAVAVLLILQAHLMKIVVDGIECTQGFLLGDGTGLGKTRLLALLLKEYYFRSKRLAVWITASEKLIPGIKKELDHYELPIIRIPGKKRKKNKGRKMGSKKDVTQTDKESNWEMPEDVGVIILTYAGLSDKTRLKRLYALLGKNFEGVIIFDEAHMAKHAATTTHSQTGETVTDIQRMYPSAHVVYSSATGASEANHMGYMTRLGLWGEGTCFRDFDHFRDAANYHRVPFLELMALELKRKGVFLARQISLRDVEIVVESEEILESNFEEVYRRSCDIWYILLAFIKQQRNGPIRKQRLCSFYGLALEYFRTLIMSSKIKKTASICKKKLLDPKVSYSLILALQRTGHSGFQRFWKREYNKGAPYSVAGDILRLALLNAGIRTGCPKLFTNRPGVEFYKIGDWTESDEERADDDISQLNIEEEYGDIFSENDLVEGGELFDVTKLIRTGSSKNLESESTSSKNDGYSFKKYSKYMVGSYSGYGLQLQPGELMVQPNELTWSVNEAASKCDEASIARLYHELHPFLPINPLDELYMRLGTIANGKFRDKISNCTGRREFYTTANLLQEFRRNYCDNSIAEEIKHFMSESRRIAIISDACSVGVSLHAEMNSKNTDKRVHITIQWPWSPDRLIQQLGRSNRCNQMQPPEFILVSSNIVAEIRFIAVVSQRLQQLGAICHGQSQSSPVLQKIDGSMCSMVGIKAIHETIESLKEDDTGFATIWRAIRCPRLNLAKHQSQENITAQVSTFFNRVLLMEPQLQEKILQQIQIKMTDLQEAGERLYSPIVELSQESKDYTMTYKSYKAIRTKDDTFEIYCFAIDRILPLDDIPPATKEVGTYYIRNYTPCLVYKSQNGYLAHYPFCRRPIPITEKSKNKSKKISISVAERKWNCFVIAARKTENVGQCFHRIATGSCGKVDCNKNLSVFEICLVTGPVFMVFTSLTEFVNQDTAQIAVVRFIDKYNYNTKKSVAGLLLNSNHKQDIERSLGRFDVDRLYAERDNAKRRKKMIMDINN